jgi:hypothetical protein
MVRPSPGNRRPQVASRVDDSRGVIPSVTGMAFGRPIDAVPAWLDHSGMGPVGVPSGQ